MPVSNLELWTITYIHISAIIVWIGAHLFETFILHSSLGRVPERSKLEIYSPLFARFRDITGVGSAITLFSGVLLAIAMTFGSFSYLVTTPWGLLSCVYFVAAMVNHSIGLKPSSLAYRALRLLGTVALVGAAVAVIIYVLLPTELRTFFIYSSDITAVVYGSMLAVVLSRIGIVQGWIRGKITRITTRLLSGEESEALVKRFQVLEHRMRLIVVPETILIFVVLALMVYAEHPFKL